MINFTFTDEGFFHSVQTNCFWFSAWKSPVSILKSKSTAVAELTSDSSEEEFHSLGDTTRSKVARVYFATDSINKRAHNFVKHKCVIPHKCPVCTKLMSFQSESSRCDTCKVIAHASCQSLVPVPCVPAPHTPTHLRKTISGESNV